MQSTGIFHRPTFKATTITPDADTNEAFMQYLANLTQLRKLDAGAYVSILAREYVKRDGQWVAGEPWQALDIDVCHELDRLAGLNEQAEQASMRMGN